MILGIKNRTENWKTARTLAPLLGDGSVRLANRLLEPLTDRVDLQTCDVRIELFWKGMRDFLHQSKLKKDECLQDFVERYKRLFPTLHNRIKGFGQFQELNCWNYDVSTNKRKTNLVNNLVNTEIDIVLESPSHLFIGEAKHEMSFHASGKLVLVHQLVRQYVTARIIADMCEPKKKVVPFVVGDNIEKLKKKTQVQFMMQNYSLKEKNILSWEDLGNLATYR